MEKYPLFDYFKERAEQKCFTVISAGFVTSDAGTGIVHCAPGFGVDDFEACLSKGLITHDSVVMPMDPDGNFLPVVSDYVGQYFKKADPNIQKDLKAKGRIVSIGQVDHPYPFCYRS